MQPLSLPPLLHEIRTMSQLENVAGNVWAVAAPHHFLGLHVGTRMTVIRLSSGGVLLYSPVPLSAALIAEINALGPVQHIVCPNLFHHVYAGDALAIWPQALLHGPRKLQKKRRDLTFHAVLSDTPHESWQGDLLPVTIAGSLLNETVLYHVPSRTLVTSDLVENFKVHPHWLTRSYLKLNGMLGNITWPPVMRVVYLNRRAARASIDRILALPFDRVVIAHGDIIHGNAREVLKKGLEWL